MAEHPISTDGGTWYPQACQVFETKTSSSFSVMKKASLKERYSMLRIEPSALMTIFHVERKIAN